MAQQMASAAVLPPSQPPVPFQQGGTATTAMNPAPGPYSPYGNNPLLVNPPAPPGAPDPATAGGGGVTGPQGGNGSFNPMMPDRLNEYGGQQIAGAQPNAADYNSVQNYANAAYENSQRYMAPQHASQNRRMQQEMINKGIDPNSAQGQEMQKMMAMQQGDQQNAAMFGAMQFGQGIQNQMAQQKQAQAGLAGQMQQAFWNQQGNADQRRLQAYLGNQQNQLGYAGLENQANIASMQDKTSRLGIQNNYNLGMAGIDAQRYTADLNHQLGMGNLDLHRQGQDFNQQQQYQDQITMALMGMTPVPGTTAIDPTGAFNQTIGSAGQNQGILGRLGGF